MGDTTTKVLGKRKIDDEVTSSSPIVIRNDIESLSFLVIKNITRYLQLIDVVCLTLTCKKLYGERTKLVFQNIYGDGTGILEGLEWHDGIYLQPIALLSTLKSFYQSTKLLEAQLADRISIKHIVAKFKDSKCIYPEKLERLDIKGSLYVNGFTGINRYNKKLPDSLNQITIKSKSYDQFELDPEKLPQHLVKLNCDDKCVITENGNFPITLEKLKINNSDQDPIQFPPCLKSLTFKWQLDDLPRSLTKLSCDDVPTIEDWKLQLPNLKHLKIKQDNYPLKKDMLPDYITHLTITFFEHQLERGILPNSITHLDLLQHSDPIKVGCLPAQLTHLTVREGEVSFDMESIPNTVTHLSIISPDFSQPLQNILPPNLITLKLNRNYEGLESQHLPSKLESLEFVGSSGFYRSHLLSHEQLDVSKLPKTLTNITTFASSGNDFILNINPQLPNVKLDKSIHVLAKSSYQITLISKLKKPIPFQVRRISDDSILILNDLFMGGVISTTSSKPLTQFFYEVVNVLKKVIPHTYYDDN